MKKAYVSLLYLLTEAVGMVRKVTGSYALEKVERALAVKVCDEMLTMPGISTKKRRDIAEFRKWISE